MSIEQSRAAWSRKRCPFGVSACCVTTQCAAWIEVRASYDERFEYRESATKPGWFSQWEVDEVFTRSEEYRSGGSQYHDNYSTRQVVTGYRLRRKVTTLISEAHGYCKRM